MECHYCYFTVRGTIQCGWYAPQKPHRTSFKIIGSFNGLSLSPCGRVQLKCDGTRWRKGEEVKRKLANGVSSQYSSHYLGTWCFQHYYR